MLTRETAGPVIVMATKANRGMRRGLANRRPLSARARPRGRTSPNVEMKGWFAIRKAPAGAEDALRMADGEKRVVRVRRRDCGKQPE